jgi:membrane protease YdiL (CAAX protease family)
MTLPLIKFDKLGIISGLATGGLFSAIVGFSPNFAMGLPPMALTGGLIVVILVAPILEEFLFRWLIQNFAQNATKMFITAVAIQGAVFALFHWYVYGGLFTNQTPFLGAFVFGCSMPFLIRYNKGNLVPAILAHSLFNFYLASRFLLAIGI